MKPFRKAFMVLCLVLSGCATATVQPQFISQTKPVPKDQEYKVLGEADGRACVFNLFGFIPIGDNRVYRAIKEAESSRSADALVSATVDRDYTWYGIGTRDCTLVHGTAIKMK